jgi:hypothetical protein
MTVVRDCVLSVCCSQSRTATTAKVKPSTQNHHFRECRKSALAGDDLSFEAIDAAISNGTGTPLASPLMMAARSVSIINYLYSNKYILIQVAVLL